MKNASANLKKLNALLKKIGADGGASPPPAFANHNDPVAVLVMSFLLWDSTTDKALAAFKRILERVVDFNDLRVCMPHETLELIGPRYPRALDRCQRLRAVLRNIYLREHSVTLARLAEAPKRDVKKYLESLEGMVPYVASRVMLLAFDTHCIPVDDQLRIQLIDAGVVDASAEVPDLTTWLTSHIKAGEGATAHFALQAWIDGMAGKATAASSIAKKPRTAASSRKTSKRAKAPAG